MSRRDLRDAGLTRVTVATGRGAPPGNVTRRDPGHDDQADLAARGVFAVLPPVELSLSEARRARASGMGASQEAPVAEPPAPRRWSHGAVFRRVLALYARFRRPEERKKG